MWLVSMNIISSAKLTGIVVSPSKYVVMTILSDKKAAPHLNVTQSICKLSFKNWSIFA